MTTTRAQSGFDRGAAVTRSMLGWGVVAGPFYLAFALVLALTRPGFELTRDALSLLMLGEGGWLQALNLVLSGGMVLVAAVGLSRAPGWPRPAAVLVGGYGLCLLLSAIFPPDPTGDFPPGVAGGEASLSGILHLVFGAVGFIGLGVAAIVAARWLSRDGGGAATWSRLAGTVVIVAFVAGAALSTRSAGVALIWLAVVTIWAWLAAASVAAYRAVPHPDLDKR